MLPMARNKNIWIQNIHYKPLKVFSGVCFENRVQKKTMTSFFVGQHHQMFEHIHIIWTTSTHCPIIVLPPVDECLVWRTDAGLRDQRAVGSYGSYHSY